MKYLVLLSLLTSVAIVSSHDGHVDDLQMPLDYVRFPYQARYPGDDEGDLRSNLARVVRTMAYDLIVSHR